MHDPKTVAFDIKSPFRQKPSQWWPKGYRNTLITIWHVDPETDGTDDSCGWFMRSRHGDKEVLAKIQRAFASEWDGEHIGWFDASGLPKLSVSATALGLFRRAAYIHCGESWRKTDQLLKRHLLDILSFAENTHDSFSDSLTMKYGPSPKADRVEHAASVVYGFILRCERPWYLQPRWHVWHWKLQIHSLQNFKRWAFSRCSKCGGRFSWGYAPTSDSWSGTGPRWFRNEHGVRHSDCSHPTSDCATASSVKP